MRIRAIYYCLKFGVLPWWCYERRRHYTCSYLDHLALNLRYAWRWITFQETAEDITFERQVNGGK